MKNSLPSWVKGFLWSVSIYLIVLVVAMIIETSCKEETICGILTFGVSVFLLPIIPIGTFIGWFLGRKTDPVYSKLTWLKGGVFGLTIWILVAAVSEYLYFYGNFPKLYKVIYFGYDEIGGVVYIIIGFVLGFIYGKVKDKRQL